MLSIIPFFKVNLRDIIIEKKKKVDTPGVMAARSGFVAFLIGLAILLLLLRGDISITSDNVFFRLVFEMFLVIGIPAVFFLISFNLEYFYTTKYQLVEINKNLGYIKIMIIRGVRKIIRKVPLDNAELVLDYPFLRIFLNNNGNKEKFRIRIDTDEFKKLLGTIPSSSEIAFREPTLNVNEEVKQLFHKKELELRIKGIPFLFGKILQIGMDLTLIFAFLHVTYLSITLQEYAVLILTIPSLIGLFYFFRKHSRFIFGSMRNVYGFLELKGRGLKIIKLGGLSYEIELDDVDEIYLIKKQKDHIIIVYRKRNRDLEIYVDPRVGDKLYSILTKIKVSLG